MSSIRRTWKAKVDRISSLPDELLLHILSFLPTDCAVGTSILSNRWKYLWTSITSFDLKGPSSRMDFQFEDFTDFVDNVFRSCSAREVDIAILDLPLSIFSCKTLSVLTLPASNWDYENIVSFDLPCLKVLHIKWKYYRKGLLEKFIGGCPVLEDLTLVGYILNDEKFVVSSPALKSLRLQPINSFNGPVILSVNAPNLEYLHLHVGFVKRCIIKGDFSLLVKASLNITDLSCCRMKGGISQCFTVLPEFHTLTSLVVVTRDRRFEALVPTQSLRSSPILEVISLDQLPDLLGHPSQCPSPLCQYPYCRRVKGMFRHGNLCNVRASGGC